MGNQRRFAGMALPVAVAVVERMIPQIPPWVGVPIVLLCMAALAVSLATEKVRSMMRSVSMLEFSYPHIDRLIDWVVGIDSQDKEQMPAYAAIFALAEARPNSYETTAINLADKARLGDIRAWGRPRPKMAIPTHITAVEQIPPDVWAYAVINAALIHGPLPQSNMAYRQQFIRPYLEDDRVLYDAVRFNKREITNLCREESILVSKRRANSGS